MTNHSKMKRPAFPPDPRQRADFHVGVVSIEREPDTVFHGRVALILMLDFEQALELQRCIVEAMQAKFVGDELLQIELEPGVLELYPNREPITDAEALRVLEEMK